MFDILTRLREIERVKHETILVPCPNCKGNGRVALPPRLKRILALLVCLGGGTSPGVYRVMKRLRPKSVTAVNNSLEDLRELKLVTRQRTDDGKAWRYQAVVGAV